jgi:hypothetical protein
MQLVKSVLRIDFESATRPWLEIREILRIAGNDPGAEIQVAPLVIDRPADRIRIVAQVRSVAVEQETPQSVKTSIRAATELITGLNGASQFPRVSLIRHDAVFIEPFEIPFYELVEQVKRHYLRDRTVVSSATDVGLVFDLHEQGGMKHVQIGPMDAKQLKTDILRWPAADLPETFVFVNAAEERKLDVEFSTDILNEFLAGAFDWSGAQAEGIVRELRGEDG